MALPRTVVKEDHRLEKEVEKTSSALAELRWHWTLNEANDKRVSFGEYATSVSRSKNAIVRAAKSYTVLCTNPGISMSDARTRANLSEDRLAAVEAVAKARGVTLETAEHKRRDEARRVQIIAAEKAEQKGTTIEEEAPAVAKWIVKAETAEVNTKAARRQKVDLRLIEAQSKLGKMIRAALDVISILRAVDWDDDAVDMLEDDVANLRALVGLMDAALVGAANVDWDAELAKLTEAEA